MTMEKKILYLECESGISGDMTVAALLDLGADQEALERALQSLPVDGFHAVVSRVKKAGLDMCDFDVVLDQAHENHDHDMEYLHGHENVHPEEHFHVHGEGPHTGELIRKRHIMCTADTLMNTEDFPRSFTSSNMQI